MMIPNIQKRWFWLQCHKPPCNIKIICYRLLCNLQCVYQTGWAPVLYLWHEMARKVFLHHLSIKFDQRSVTVIYLFFLLNFVDLLIQSILFSSLHTMDTMAKLTPDFVWLVYFVLDRWMMSLKGNVVIHGKIFPDNATNNIMNKCM